MSNVVISPFSKSYPVFEADQVLSDAHLNDLRLYLQGEIFQTRNKLIGTGIVNGLEVAADNTTIKITAGAGITASGQLIATRFEAQASFSQAAPFQFRDEETPLKSRFADKSIYELIPDDHERLDQIEGKQSLVDLLVPGQDAGVVLYLDTREIDIKSCFTTGCDERGKTTNQAVRPLLILSGESIEERQRFIRPALAAIPRIQISHSNAPDLTRAYRTACNNQVLNSLQTAFNRVDALLKVRYSDKTRASLPSLTTMRDLVLNSRPQYMQFYYEFLSDLRSALLELFALLEGKDNAFRDIISHFDDHLALGPLDPRSKGFERTDFFPSRPDNSDGDLLDHIKFLWKRAVAMIDCLMIDASATTVKFTPSLGQDHPLQQQSMPYFYADFRQTQMHEYWNYELNKNGKSHRVLSYFNRIYNHSGEREYIQPLEYHYADKELLLAEGIIGNQKSNALTQINQLRKTHHLPFGLVALRVSDNDHDSAYPFIDSDDPLAVREDNFKDFIEEHPGLYHARGVGRHETLVLIFKAEPDDTDGPVIATLVLPYICCGKPIAPPPPFVLDAHDDNVVVKANRSINIHVINNDDHDPLNPVELDFVYDYTLKAKDDQVAVDIEKQRDIQVLNNDSYDPNAPVELDFVIEIAANDVHTKAAVHEDLDIHVLENDTIDQGPVELDFDDQP